MAWALKAATAEHDKAQKDLEAARQSLDDVNWKLGQAKDNLADASSDLDSLYEDIDQARRDYKAASSHVPFGLRKVISAVIGVAADLLDDAGFGRAADFLRSVSDRIIEKATDRLAPETVRAHAMRKLANAPDEWRDEPDSGLDGPR